MRGWFWWFMQWTPCPNSSRWPHTSSSYLAGQCLSLKTPLVGCLGEDMYLGNSSTLRFFPTALRPFRWWYYDFLYTSGNFPLGWLIKKKRASEKSTDSTEELRTMDSLRSSHLTMSGSTVWQSLKIQSDSGSLLKASCIFNSTDLCSPRSTEVTWPNLAVS